MLGSIPHQACPPGGHSDREHHMAKFEVRYKDGYGPKGSNDTIEVEAEMFVTAAAGDFVDFYDQARSMGSKQDPMGKIVFRAAVDPIIDIKLKTEA
jgi:hypothetical protein